MTAVTALMAGLAVAASASPGAASPAGRAAALQAPVLHWASCDNGFQCAKARVPLDYRHPDGSKISIVMVRHLAIDPAQRLGSLFVNGGGPNQQIPGFLAGYPAIPAALREHFDIISFDPRGFGESTAVQCFASTAAEKKFLSALPPFPVGARQDTAWERTYTSFDTRCAKVGGPLLDHDTSADVARDMDLLRAAVGDPVLNYVGLSYGTGLGAIYANLFPGKVGRMLLDGNLDPVAWSSNDHALPEFVRDGTARGFATVMNSFLALCGQAGTSACAFSAGSPAATRAKWHTLLARLLRHPVTVGSPQRTVTYADLISDVPPSQSQFPQTAALLQQYWIASGGSAAAPAGSRPTTATSASPGSAAGNRPASPEAAYSGLEQTLAEYCADTANPRRPGEYPAIARHAAAHSGGFGLEWTWMDEPCAQWPVTGTQDRYTGPWNRHTASTILLFGNTGDPVTPYHGSVSMARDLGNARLLTINEFGHTEFYNPDICATSYEVGYLLTGALPPVGKVCQADAPLFPAS